MSPERGAVLAASAVVVLLAAATGPHVGLVSIPESGFGTGATPGSGTADVTVVSTPDRAELTAGDYGDVHYLTTEAPTLRIANVTGAPYLTISLDVEEVWVSRSTVHTLRPGQSGTRSLSLGRASIEDLETDNRTLPGRLRVTLHDSDGSRTIYDEPIVVEVTG